MGSRSSDRIHRLISLRQTPPGCVRMAVCRKCGHMAPLPVRELLRHFGDLEPVDMALLRLCCEECGERKVEAKVMPLCAPGCRNWR